MACMWTPQSADYPSTTPVGVAANPLAEVNDFVRRHGDDNTAPEWVQQVTDETPETSFENVTITIQAPNSRLAYDRLCTALAGIEAEFTTDTYCVDGGESRCTSELWPKDTEATVSEPIEQ
jgi:hypothetical protein